MKKGMKLVLISGLTLMLSACYSLSEEDRIKDHRTKCEMYGFLPGTEQFAHCVEGREIRYYETKTLVDKKPVAETRKKFSPRKRKTEERFEVKHTPLPRYPHHHNLDKKATYTPRKVKPAESKVHEKIKTDNKHIQTEPVKIPTETQRQPEPASAVQQEPVKQEPVKKRVENSGPIDTEQKHSEERKRRRNTAPLTSSSETPATAE